MRLVLAVIVMLSFYFCSLSNENNDLVIKPTLETGHTYVYYMKNVRSDIKNERVHSADSISNYSYFIVDDSYDDKYKIVYKNAIITNTGGMSEDIVDLASELDLSDTAYETDMNGMLIGVLGWDTISVILRKKASDLIDSKTLDETNLKNTLLRTISKKILDYVSSPKGFVDYYMTDARNLHLGMGLNKSDLDKEFAEDLFVFQFGLVVPSTSRIALAEEPEKGKIELIKTTKINEKDLKKLISQLYSIIIKDENEREEHLKSVEFSVEKETKIIYSESSGIPLEIETNYEIVSKFARSIDKITEKRRLVFKELLID